MTEIVKRTAQRDWTITVSNGDSLKLEEGKRYTVDRHAVAGRIIVLSRFAVSLDSHVFDLNWSLDDFRDEVSEFCRLYVSEVSNKYAVDYSEKDGEFLADITLIDNCTRTWHLDIRVHPETEDDLVIMLEDDNYLEANAEGVYRCLWEQASLRMSRAKSLLSDRVAQEL